jgi:hypothetical protein
MSEEKVYPEPGIAGRMTSSLERDLGPEDLIISLLGWMADGTPCSPPTSTPSISSSTTPTSSTPP